VLLSIDRMYAILRNRLGEGQSGLTLLRTAFELKKMAEEDNPDLHVQGVD